MQGRNAEQSAERNVEQSAERNVEQSAERNVEQSAERTAEQTVEQNMKRHMERNAEQTAGQQMKKDRKIWENDIRKSGMQEQEKQTQERIWRAASELKPDSHKKKESLLLIQDCIQSKKIHSTSSPCELLGIQLQYISPIFWVLQGGLLLFLILLLYRLPGQGAELTDYLWRSSVVAVWMGVLSHGVLGRHFSSRMAELEQSCYINLTQMWTIRMILTTGVDIGILTVFSGGVALRTDTFFGRVAVYLLVPFVLSNVCCLLVVSALRSSRGKFTMAALAVVTALLAMSPSAFPEIYTVAYLWVWLCLLLFGAAVFAGQIRSCYGRMTRGEMICLN